MTVHAPSRRQNTWLCAVAGLLALVLSRLQVGGIVLAALAVVAIVFVQRMRITADSSGVTVVNLFRPRMLPWSDIVDFRIGHKWMSTCLNICKQDGGRVHAWAVTMTGAAVYSPSQVEEIIGELRERLMLANGWSQEELDSRSLEDALRAAGRGEYLDSSSLIAEGRIDSQSMSEHLIERYRRRNKRATVGATVSYSDQAGTTTPRSHR